ncbi:hypothetical protein METBIDRAFT_91428 [Metschnikowia bicuspidata var. bicuspidata NRRL YB-4993]|uniref:Uncharacterized protein n=1 Tax=Metschnikowia bicuspidata var. bicuspidata NRRL YB-4993 TaxID=869754 RepID=A0A1A0HFF5_9ASCO|nr:hypothetical protein METBIDRAFT_91428 [Metschnikowia bicuspidata var. bicuspidata NRRL YB-4993]OBA22731.1 hypothetical protein METBIDRAFT_91428 [Metschnikowia bicuspidata var. bicuspidata NRRL YB-4993]
MQGSAGFLVRAGSGVFLEAGQAGPWGRARWRGCTVVSMLRPPRRNPSSGFEAPAPMRWICTISGRAARLRTSSVSGKHAGARASVWDALAAGGFLASYICRPKRPVKRLSPGARHVPHGPRSPGAVLAVWFVREAAWCVYFCLGPRGLLPDLCFVHGLCLSLNALYYSEFCYATPGPVMLL